MDVLQFDLLGSPECSAAEGEEGGAESDLPEEDVSVQVYVGEVFIEAADCCR